MVVVLCPEAIKNWGYHHGRVESLRAQNAWSSHGTILQGLKNGFAPMVCPAHDKRYNVLEPCIYNPTWSLGRALKFITLLQDPRKKHRHYKEAILLMLHEQHILQDIDLGLCHWRSIYETVQHDPNNFANPVKRPFEHNTPVDINWDIIGDVPNRDAMLFDDLNVLEHFDTVLEYKALRQSSKICIRGEGWKFHLSQMGVYRTELFSGEERLSYAGIFITLLMNGHLLPSEELLQMGRDTKMHKISLTFNDVNKALCRALGSKNISAMWQMWMKREGLLVQ